MLINLESLHLKVRRGHGRQVQIDPRYLTEYQDDVFVLDHGTTTEQMYQYDLSCSCG